MDFKLAGGTFKTIIENYILGVIYILIPILIGVAFIVFFWGLSQFILHSNSPEGIKKGRTYMLWGILALFILFTFNVIIGLVSSELEIGNRDPDRNSILLPTGGGTPSVTTDTTFRLPDGTPIN